MYSKCVTNEQRILYIRNKLKHNDQWILKALYTIYLRQTEDEKRMGTTKYDNGIGFTGPDGEILTSYAKQVISKNYLIHINQKQTYPIGHYLTTAQEKILRKTITKYARQLVKITLNKI